MTTEETINRFLNNYLNDVCTPDRLACFIANGMLEICIPERIIFDPITQRGILKKRYSGGVVINGSKLDKSIMMKIFNKLSKPKDTTKEDDRLKRKYGIEKRSRITPRIREEIIKYESTRSNK